MHYDGDRDPDAEAWLALDEGERLRLVEAHHEGIEGHARMPRPRLHAALHLVVEDQLARGEPPEVRRAVARLRAGGLPRHEAVHAVALLVSNVASAAMEGQAWDPRAYARELDALTVERWRSLAAGE